MTDKMVQGRLGEQLAADFLLGIGYTIIEKNYRVRGGEIDIIAFDGEILVFVEVKTRKNANFALAREYVTRKKQSHIIHAATLYVMRHKLDCRCRFDVIEVYTTQNIQIVHLIDAFE